MIRALLVLLLIAGPAFADEPKRAPINPEQEEAIDAHCYQRKGHDRWSPAYKACVEEQRWINAREADRHREAVKVAPAQK